MKKKVIKKIKKMVVYYKENGMERFIWHVFSKIFHTEEMSYVRWRKKNSLTTKELLMQQKKDFAVSPLFSIVVPLYYTPTTYLKELIESIQRQTYVRWELCLSDGSGKGKLEDTYLKTVMKEDRRIKLVVSEFPLSIADNTNCALEIAEGDFVVFVDHDDMLAPNALYECVQVVNEHPSVEVMYTDEDKVSMDGKDYFQPHFKSDFNLDLLRSMNYICHMFVVKKALQERVGQLQDEYNGAQDYDFVLRCIEKTKEIHHISKILYHWRAHRESTAENPESKLYAFEAGRRAIEKHLERLKIDGTVELGEYLGLYRVKYQLTKEPLISVLIPNREHKEDLDRCINSLFEISDYTNIEIILIENQSVSEEIFQYYQYVQKKHTNVKVVIWEQSKDFNYSALNNFGVKYAKGEFLLFLNNDIEVINKNCIREMVSYAVREDIGAVGAKLYYPDNSIQHAGVILGLGGIAGHAFKGLLNNENGYFSRAICAQDYTAVTAACMLVPKRIFEIINGFDEKLKVAFNDIDLCMKIRKQDKLIVYVPYAQLFHYESKSRGMENTKEKIDRFNREVSYFAKKWKSELEIGDPYYNNNLTLEKHDFSLKLL